MIYIVDVASYWTVIQEISLYASGQFHSIQRQFRSFLFCTSVKQARATSPPGVRQVDTGASVALAAPGKTRATSAGRSIEGAGTCVTLVIDLVYRRTTGTSASCVLLEILRASARVKHQTIGLIRTACQDARSEYPGNTQMCD